MPNSSTILQRPGLFTESPFGPNWDAKPVSNLNGFVTDEIRDPDTWYYEIISDSDGTKLLSQYQNDVAFEELYGSHQDKETDIFIYYERDDPYNQFGTVCFVRMNKALSLYISEDSSFRGVEWLAKEIVKKNEEFKNNADFIPFDTKKLQAAIAYDIAKSNVGSYLNDLVTSAITGVLNFVSKKVRECKLDRSFWDPTTPDYRPVLRQSVFIEEIVRGWKNLKKRQQGYLKELVELGDKVPDLFSWLAKIIYTIGGIWKWVIDAIDTIVNVLEKANHAIVAINAFLCGIVNELIETIAGLIDLVALLFTLDKKEEQQTIKESLENALQDFNTAPLKQHWEKFTDLVIHRYSNKAYYELAYQLGEDVVVVGLFLPGIISLIRTFKNVPKWFEASKSWANKQRSWMGLPENLAEELKQFVRKRKINTDIDLAKLADVFKGDKELCERILLSAKEIVEGKSLQELVSHFNLHTTPRPGSLSNYQARIWYHWQKNKIIQKAIPDLTGKLREKAVKAYNLRNKYRFLARQYMKDRELALFLEKNEPNLDFKTFVARKKSESFLSDDEIYNSIIRSSTKTNKLIDKLFKLNKHD